jgi:DNA replication protein DnaC
MNDREDKRILRWQKQARFPWIKVLDEYDFSYPEKIDKGKVMDLAECRWIDSGGNVIFFGPSGVGKTHLSTALGLEAIKKGYETRFIVMEYLIEIITTALNKDKGQVAGDHRKKLLNMLMNYKLLILDDLAYSHINEDVASFLFLLIRRRHELNKSTIFTSNEGVDKWEKYFAGDKVRAMAALDRIMEDCVAITIHGQSFRVGGPKSKNKSTDRTPR